MKIIKLTVLTRSYDTLFNYGKQSQSFWEDLAGRLRGGRQDLVIEKRGRYQCSFYFPMPEGDLVADVENMIRSLGPDPSGFVISASPLCKADLVQLEKTAPDGVIQMPWYKEVKEQFVSTDAVPLSGKAPEADIKREPEEADEAAKEEAPAEIPAPVPAKAAPDGDEQKDDGKGEVLPVPESGADLANEAARIKQLKDSLLSIVHGQRHAVDEVVQAIFECDAFRRSDPSRKGPLATFLFTGPSGVGKTFLAETCAHLLGEPEPLVVNMSEYSDNLANAKFNGEHNQPANVTGYVRSHPHGIIIFDEIEKAHINTIYLFLQILDSGVLRDMKINKDVSFRDTIIFITTNAGASLYDDPSVIDLSGVSRKAILEALRTDIKPGTTNEPYFPECITTRFANGHVLLFNHLEPYSLMQIVKGEITKQMDLFRNAYGVDLKYDADKLAALVLYSAGGTADARSLRGIAKNMVVKELQDVVLQTHQMAGEGVNALKEIEFIIQTENGDPAVRNLFAGHEATQVLLFADNHVIRKIEGKLESPKTKYEFISDAGTFKRRVRGVVDYVLLDPAAESRTMDRTPNDLEDVNAEGNDLFRYLREYFPEIPVYFLDVRGLGEESYATLLAKGGRGLVRLDPDHPETAAEPLNKLSFGALVNNATFSLGRSGKALRYNCSQFSIDESRSVISFDKLSVGYIPGSNDGSVVVRSDENGVTFKDVAGCKEAKKALQELCACIADPRETLSKGKKLPKGVLLYGPPGTGKTMMAKALANEAGVAFLPTTATALFGPYVGESEKNVRDLFRRARRYAPAIIFIDEVDAIARVRTASSNTAHNEDTLNAFIAEMDGFETNEKRPVFIVAATNYDISGSGAKVLDPAFVRRFERQIFVDLPDTEARYELLKALLARHGVDFGAEHESTLKNLADRSSCMSCSDLTSIIELFIRDCEDETPTVAQLMETFDTYRFGEIKEIDPADLKQTAYHESGHALISRLLTKTPSFLTVVSRGNFGGYMEPDKSKERGTSSFGELMSRVCVSLAGRAAEIEVYGKEAGINSGASADLAQSRYLVKLALNEYGMGDKLYAPGSDEDCEKLMQEQFARTAALLHEHRGILDALTDALTEKKSMNRAELEQFFAENKI